MTTHDRRSSAPRSARSASPFAGFRADHARVLVTLDAIEHDVFGTRGLRAGAVAKLGAMVAMLDRQFATHMTAEDAVLYPWLAQSLPESRLTIEALAADHSELRSLLAGLAAEIRRPASHARDEQIGVQLRDLVDLLRLHVRREEAAVFDVADRILRAAEARDLSRRLSDFVSVVSPEPTGDGRARNRAARPARERKS